MKIEIDDQVIASAVCDAIRESDLNYPGQKIEQIIYEPLSAALYKTFKKLLSKKEECPKWLQDYIKDALLCAVDVEDQRRWDEANDYHDRITKLEEKLGLNRDDK